MVKVTAHKYQYSSNKINCHKSSNSVLIQEYKFIIILFLLITGLFINLFFTESLKLILYSSFLVGHTFIHLPHEIQFDFDKNDLSNIEISIGQILLQARQPVHLLLFTLTL